MRCTVPIKRCSNCDQPLLGRTEPATQEPCGRCGYLEGMDLLDELPADEPTTRARLQRITWWLAMVVVAGAMALVVWIMLRFQESLVGMTQGL